MERPEDSPVWIKYYAGANLAALAVLSRPAELAHRRLADYFWSTGRWVRGGPGVIRALARVPARQWERVLAELAGVGWVQGRGGLRHAAVRGVWLEAKRYRRKKQSAGAQGAEATRKQWRRRQGSARAVPGRGKARARAMPQPGCQGTAGGAPGPVPLQDSTAPDQTVNAERLPRSGSPRGQEARGEADFMAELREVCETWRAGSSQAELANWGGWWRNRYREDPGKMRRVLADVRSLVKEGRIMESPGAAAVDLWGRLP